MGLQRADLTSKLQVRGFDFSRLLQNLQHSGGKHAENSLLEMFFGAYGGEFFGDGDVDELIQGCPFGLGHLARFRHQGSLQSQGILASPEVSIPSGFCE